MHDSTDACMHMYIGVGECMLMECHLFMRESVFDKRMNSIVGFKGWDFVEDFCYWRHLAAPCCTS